MRYYLMATLLLAGAVSSLPPSSGGAAAEPAARPFADFGFMPRASSYEGRVFRLSQQYPKELPDARRRPEFFEIDFQKDWRKYLLAARDYCFAGNVRGGDVEDDWDAAAQSPPRWFHMPWQHFGPSGREGIHGLTKEAPVQVKQLAPTQTATGCQTYAVAVFNEFGGYTIGQVWKDPDHPDARRATFPDGTVICKVLFTDVPPAQVPSLVNPLSWQGYITDNFSSTHRSIRTLSLIQMDLMMRDPRSPYGWVFGTFQYNGNLNQANRWHNLVPVGLQWGNDPEITDNDANPQPVRTRRNPKLKQTVINEDEELPPTHLGWNGRLNGPVDNPMSSCMSCHATAQAPAKSPLSPLFQDNPPAPGSKEWMRWFQNYKCGERFDKDKPTSATDFSLQLALSLQNFYNWRNEGKGLRAERYKKGARKQAKALRASPYTQDVPEQGEVFKIQRDFKD
jgi:hypothetical protein